VSQRPRILCAFGSRSLRTNVGKGLNRARYRLSYADTPPDLLDAGVLEAPDLILCDTKLVGGDDLALLEAVRSSSAVGAAIPIILLSGGSCSDTLQNTAEALATRLVAARDLSARQLRELIDRELDSTGGPSEG
jgi:CheY-like chemotaxis protein